MTTRRTVHFFAVTNYHVIVASLIAESLPESINTVLVLSGGLPNVKSLQEKLLGSPRWADVIIFDPGTTNKSRNLNVVAKIIGYVRLRARVSHFIRSNRINELYLFTVGEMATNLFSASRIINLKYLCEDGTYPYYGGVEMYDIGNKHFKNMAKTHGWFRYVERMLRVSQRYCLSILFPGIVIDTKSWFSEIVLIKPCLLDSSNDSLKLNVRGVNLQKLRIKEVFSVLSDVYEYSDSDIYNNADVIFIDSGMVGDNFLSMQQQVDYTLRILEAYSNKKVILKISPYCSKTRLNYISYKVSNIDYIEIDHVNIAVPWEIIYANNITNLRLVTIATYRSTAVLSPFILFDENPNIAVYSLRLFEDFNLIGEDKVYTEQFIELVRRLRNYYTRGKIEIPSNEC